MDEAEPYVKSKNTSLESPFSKAYLLKISGSLISQASAVKELMTGIGPVTSALPMRRTTDCATSAYSEH